MAGGGNGGQGRTGAAEEARWHPTQRDETAMNGAGGMSGNRASGAESCARLIVERLRSRGFDAYFAGGCVRDLLLGRVPDDFDVATNALPEVVLNLFERTFSVGAHFGVVLVRRTSMSEATAPRLRRFAVTVLTRMGGGLMRCVSRPPRRMCAARLHHQWHAARSAGRSTGWLRTMMPCSTLWGGATICSGISAGDWIGRGAL